MIFTLLQIIKRILGPVLTITIWTTIICVLWDRGHNVSLTNSVVPLLSVVVSALE